MKRLSAYARWLWRSSEGMRTPLILNVLMGCISILLNLLFIWLTKRLVDMATGAIAVASGREITLCAVYLVSAMLLRIVVNAVDTTLENNTFSKMNFLIRQRLYSNLMMSQWEGKERMHSGDTLNRLFSDVDQVTRIICQELPSTLTTLFQLLAAFIFLSTMDIRLALALLLITPFFLLFSRLFFRRMRRLTRDIREDESKVQSHIQETLQHKTVIQSLEMGEVARDHLEELQDEEYSRVQERTRLNVLARTMISLAFATGYVAALLWGVHGIYHGAITFGVLTAFLQLVGQIQGPSVRLARQIPGFIYATASIDRLSELEKAPKEETGVPVALEGVCGVRFEGVSFRYHDGKRDILKDFSFDFPPGSKTSIEGETGVGKSTMIRLILSLLKPTEGKVLIYNDSESVEASSLSRVNLVYVPQGNSLFSGTIRDNLLLGDASADEGKMWQALDLAAASFVRDLPQGLDTVCGEQGTGLSEGQAQRIAIARGLLRPGSVMLLDEFSSSLDRDTEELLMKNLTAGYSDKTMIFITHREKISEYCDRVLKLQTICGPLV